MSNPIFVNRVRPVANGFAILELITERLVAAQSGNIVSARIQKVFAWPTVDPSMLQLLGLKMTESNKTQDSNGREVYDVSAQKVDFTKLIQGQIVIEETTKPNTYQGRIVDQPKRQPTRDGSEMPVLTFDGAPIYRRTRFTTNLQEQDTKIQHNGSISLAEYEAIKMDFVTELATANEVLAPVA